MACIKATKLFSKVMSHNWATMQENLPSKLCDQVKIQTGRLSYRGWLESWILEFASIDTLLSRQQTEKGVDQTGQMHRLICTFAETGFFITWLILELNYRIYFQISREISWIAYWTWTPQSNSEEKLVWHSKLTKWCMIREKLHQSFLRSVLMCFFFCPHKEDLGPWLPIGSPVKTDQTADAHTELSLC